MIRIALFLLAAAAALAQTAGLPPDSAQQFFDNNGQPLAGGFVRTCSAGGACPGTEIPSYQDANSVTPNTNPVVLDSSGRASIWLTLGVAYKLVIQNSSNVTIKTVDNVIATPPFISSITNFWTISGTAITNNNGGGTGDVNIGGGLNVTNSVTINSTLKLRDRQSAANYAIFQAAPCMGTLSGGVCSGADVTWTLPSVDAQGCLVSNGIGQLSFLPCGSTGVAAGNNTDVQFNSGGSLSGSDNFTWNNTGQVAVITAQMSSTQGLIVLKGYVQADNGFAAVNNSAPSTPLNFNVIQAPQGGMAALSFTATNYTEVGNHSGTPPATNSEPGFPHQGALYFDTGATALKVWNGSAWVTLSTGGATSPGGSNTQIQLNSSGSFGGSPNLTFASQELVAIGSSSSNPVIYGAVGFIQSDAGFLALPGTATRYNVIQAPGGGMAAKSFTATKYVQSGHNAGVPPLTSTDTFAAGALFWNDSLGSEQVFNGSSWLSLVTSPASTFFLPTTGGSGSVSCTGVTSGWVAVSSDNYLVVCNSSARYRVALTSF